MQKDPTADSQSDLKHRAETWRKAEDRLALIRAGESMAMNLAGHILALEDAFQAALTMSEPTTTSGLIDLQAAFARVACKEPAPQSNIALLD